VIRVRVDAPTAQARRNLEAVLREDRGLSVVDTRSSLVTPDVVVLKRDSIPLLLAATTPTAPAPTAAVVMLLDDLDREAAAAAVRAGALAVLPADAEPRAIRAAVHAAAAGLASLPAGFRTGLLHSSDDAPPADGVGHALTPREAEILALLGVGLANKQIGARLGISQHTVKTHVAAIYEKLGASNRAEAVATGLRRGLILL
jgi:DNA-binding NarL/FixJ family response regulator